MRAIHMGNVHRGLRSAFAAFQAALDDLGRDACVSAAFVVNAKGALVAVSGDLRLLPEHVRRALGAAPSAREQSVVEDRNLVLHVLCERLVIAIIASAATTTADLAELMIATGVHERGAELTTVVVAQEPTLLPIVVAEDLERLVSG